ncbi:hypothetical protein [Glycomyces salinus]|uniref:hypothetical protein n=1 Tax=Glycomyces salinus TaxID=980294 RepID=UPI0018EAB7A6|nr:hypothetical protein [Glycomyces salinus]
MTASAVHREQLRAFATGNIDRAQELNDSLAAEDRAKYNNLLGALFAVLLDNHFQGDTSPQAIAAFVGNIRRDYEAAGQPFNAWTVEGVLRATAGEEHLLNEFSPEDLLATQTLIVGRLAINNPEVQEDIDRFLDEAEAIVVEWEREE